MKPVNNFDTFGRRVRMSRTEMGLSQGELAEMIKTSTRMVSLYERDEVKPTIEVLSRLAKQLKTSVAYLMGEDKFLKDPELEKMMQDILSLPENEQRTLRLYIASVVKSAKDNLDKFSDID